MKLLIADDLDISRRCLAIFLTRHGYEVLEATNGKEALHVARRERPDVVITDLIMSEIDGWEFIRTLRDDARIAHTPVIGLSEKVPNENIHAMARSMGVRHVLQKSFFQAPVLDAVRHLLDGGEPHYATFLEQDSPRLRLQRISEKLAKELSGFTSALGEFLASAHHDASPVREESFQVVIDQNPLHAALIHISA